MKRHKELWVMALLLVSAVGFRATSSSNPLAGPRLAEPARAKVAPAAARVNPSHRPANDATSKPRVLEAYGKLPMAFEANRGQTDQGVKFISRGSGYSVFLTANEAVLALHKSSNGKPQRADLERIKPQGMKDEPWAQQDAKSGNPAASLFAGRAAAAKPESITKRLSESELSAPAVLRMKLMGAKSGARVIGQKQLPGKSNYFIGNDPKKWHTQVPAYAEVRYQGAYPGIDLVYYGHQGQLEYDFVVAPGFSPKAITLEIAGTAHGAPLRIDRQGDLVATLDGGQISFHKPVVYQPTGAERMYVDGWYVLKGEHEVGFEIAAYDPTKALVIDPTLIYSTYLGGTRDDYGVGIAVDSAGNAYVTGFTGSMNFPTSNPLQSTIHGGYDAFVAALDPTGATLLYSTYLGGTGTDYCFGIAVDSAGNAYVTGYTNSTDFPTSNPLQPTNHGGYDAFVAALDPTGATLLYSTYLGGTGDDYGYGIAVDSTGNAYVTGFTTSWNFPTSNPLQPTNHGGFFDAFVAALDPTGATLLYSTYLGGTGYDVGRGIAVDSAGNAYVTGATDSTNFPTSNPLQPTIHGGLDAFVAALDPTGATLLYSTYLGGTSDDYGLGIAVDSADNAYVTGYTDSTNFPTSNPLQPTNHGGRNAFVAALDPTGATLLYSTYLGGTGTGYCFGIAVDSAGNAYVTGFTGSTNFPTSNPVQPTNHGGDDAFVAALDPTGATLLYSTYLGGTGTDFGQGIAVDSAGNAYVTGYTNSTNFPTSNPLQPTNHGGYDAFVAKITP
ncbi:MAG TPA: SBBP repeat-containing protein [Candidatus Dormibacteraeota bacterium]|nr:SBBP repeat-containing protein [Candidatus Dormibacteraeota bacterium]